MTRITSTPHFGLTSRENSALLHFKISRNLVTDYNRIITHQGEIMTIFPKEFSSLPNLSENFIVLFFRIILVSKTDDTECRNYI